MPVKTSLAAGALLADAVPQLTDPCCPSQELLPKPLCFVMGQEQAAHRPAVFSPSVQSSRRNLDVEPHQVPEGVPVVDVCLHARRVRCHGHIVETVPGVSTGHAMKHTHISVKAASPKQEPELAALRAVDGPCGAITSRPESAIGAE